MCFLIQGLAQLKEIVEITGGKPVREEFSNFSSLSKFDPKLFKRMEEDGKTFPGSFSPVSIVHNQEILVVPMRYRVRPAGTVDEVPGKYNVFNARRDSLTKRKTWETLIGRKHGLFVMKKFYEWVEADDHKKKLIGFYPTKEEQIYVPCLYDKWVDNDSGQHFFSFAVITDGPPQEIEDAGHDRCPIHIPKSNIKSWLDTSVIKDFAYWDQILSQKTQEYFEYTEDYQITKKRKNDDRQLKLF